MYEMIVHLALTSQYLWWEDKIISIHESVDSVIVVKVGSLTFLITFLYV